MVTNTPTLLEARSVRLALSEGGSTEESSESFEDLFSTSEIEGGFETTGESEISSEADISIPEADVSGSETVVSESEADISGSGADVSGSEADVSVSEEYISGSEADVSGSEADISGSEADVSGSEADVSGSEADVSGSEADVSGSETVVSGSEEDVSGSETVVSGSEEDVSGSEEDGGSESEESQTSYSPSSVEDTSAQGEPSSDIDHGLEGTDFTIEDQAMADKVMKYIKGNEYKGYNLTINGGITFNITEGTGYSYIITSSSTELFTLKFESAPDFLKIYECLVSIPEGKGIIDRGELINLSSSSNVNLSFNTLSIDVESARFAQSTVVEEILIVIDNPVTNVSEITLPRITVDTEVYLSVKEEIIEIFTDYISIWDKNLHFKNSGNEVIGPKNLNLLFTGSLRIKTTNTSALQAVRRQALSSDVKTIFDTKAEVPVGSNVEIFGTDIGMETYLFSIGRFNLNVTSLIALTMNSTTQAVIDVPSYSSIKNITTMTVGYFLVSTFSGKYTTATFKEGGIEIGGVVLHNVMILNTNIDKSTPLLLKYDGGTTSITIILDNSSKLLIDATCANIKNQKINIISDGESSIEAGEGVVLEGLLNITTSTGTSRNISDFYNPTDSTDEPTDWIMDNIIYIAVGGGVLLVLIIIVVCCCCCKKNNDDSSSEAGEKMSNTKPKRQTTNKKKEKKRRGKRSSSSDSSYSLSSSSQPGNRQKIRKNNR